ncbi:MAG: hypothetical protein IH609_08745 [Dehalococcoidia bacterium]|nr:hypothetical protein [Dehalococcoidia bacterium]
MEPSIPWYELEDGDGQLFDLCRARVLDGDPTTGAFAKFLLQGLTDPEYLRSLMEKRGLASLADYVANRRVSSKLSIRVADFGEIAAGRLLEAEEALHRPIEKLRYKFNRDWSPHLTDIFAVARDDNDEIVAFAYCEVKAGTTAPAPDVAANAYQDLIKAWREKVPEILHFTSERLWEAHRQAEYEQLDRAIASSSSMPQILRLVLVFDQNAWSDDSFDYLSDAIGVDGASGSALKCYLVRRSELRALIEDAYAEMAKLAQAV